MRDSSRYSSEESNFVLPLERHSKGSIMHRSGSAGGNEAEKMVADLLREIAEALNRFASAHPKADAYFVQAILADFLVQFLIAHVGQTGAESQIRMMLQQVNRHYSH